MGKISLAAMGTAVVEGVQRHVMACAAFPQLDGEQAPRSMGHRRRSLREYTCRRSKLASTLASRR